MKISIFKYLILFFFVGKEPIKKWISPEINYLTYVEEKPKYKVKYIKEEIKGKEISYGNMNFIFYKNRVYLFTKPINLGFLCGTGIDYSKPFKQNITPDSLVELNVINFQKIVLNKIKQINLPLEVARKQYNSYELEHSRILISIGIDKDSVKGKLPALINKTFRDKRIRYTFVRKLTEEEREVAKAKYYKTPYNFNKINWKVGFSETELY
jgi:hypothetical protein